MPFPSPELTGNAGATYESQIAALYLAGLLVRGEPRGLEGTITERVAVQRASLGAPLDDIVVVARRSDGIEAQLHLQAKRALRLTAAASNTDFRAVVFGTWDTLASPGFARGVHRLGAATEDVPSDALRAARRLHSWAVLAQDGGEFRTRLEAGLHGATTQRVRSAVEQLIQERAVRRPTDEDIWQFWRHFIVLHIEVTGEGARDRHDTIERLRLANLPRAVDLLASLEAVAREMAAAAGSVARETLQERLAGRFALENLAPQDTIEAITVAARSAARTDLRAFQLARPTAGSVTLSFERASEATPTAISQGDVVALLRSRDDIILEAPPGAGKSTTLLQLADAILTDSVDRVPIVLPLPELAVGRRSLFVEVSQRAAFRTVEVEGLRRVAAAGRLVLLGDGWNELSPAQVTTIRLELEKFRREYPSNPILLATRPQVIPFLLNTKAPSRHHRVALSLLTEAQQLSLFAAERGSRATEFRRRAGRVPGLRDVLRIPLYARAIARIASGDTLPTTREEVFSLFIASLEHDPAHHEELERGLSGCHRQYLRRVATYLTEHETTALEEADLRRELLAVADDLLAAGQIAIRPEPRHVIDLLVSHHVLLRLPGPSGQSSFAFQHQVFQEWFASFHAEECIIAAAQMHASAEPSASLDAVIDEPKWEEPLLFALERLSQRTHVEHRAVARSILRALGIDPMLAAEMVRRSTDAVWALVAEPTLAFADAWLATDAADRALAFILGSGRYEFADRFWSRIDDEKLYQAALRLRWGRGISPAALGADAATRLARLPSKRRSTLVHDLVMHGGDEGTALAVQVAKAGPAVDVLVSIVDALTFEGDDNSLLTLAPHLTQDAWNQLALRYTLGSAPAPFVSRLVAEKETLAKTLPLGRERIRLKLELDGVTDDPLDPTELATEALNTKLGDYGAAYELFARLASRHPEPLTRAIIAHALQGGDLPYGAAEHVRSAGAQQQEQLLKAASDPKASRIIREVAARALDANSVSIVICEYLKIDVALVRLWRDDHAAAAVASDAHRTIRTALAEALQYVSIESLIGAIVATPAAHPTEIAALAELMFRWADDDRERKLLPVPFQLLGRVCDTVGEWVNRLLESPDTHRSELSNVALAIARIGEPLLVPAIKRLLDHDLTLWRGQRAKRDENWRQGRRDVRRDSEASTSYVQLYLNAFLAFDEVLVRDTLLSYLDDPEFAVEAAFGLRRSGGGLVQPEKELSVSGSKEWELIAQRRAARASSVRIEAPPHPVAAAVLDRIEPLLETEEGRAVQRGISMATAAARMDVGTRWKPIEAAVTAPGHIAGRRSLMRAILLAGESLRPEWVMAGLDDALRRAGAEPWREDQLWWEVEEWFAFAAFTLPTASIIPRIASLPTRFRNPHSLRTLVSALGFAGGTDAVATLQALAEVFPALLETYEWLDAIARVGSEEAGLVFVRVAFDEDRARRLRHQVFPLSESVAALVMRYPAVREALLTRLAQPIAEASRQVVASLMPALRDQEVVMAALNVVTTDGQDSLTAGLVRAVEELAVVRRPVAGSPNVYEQEPAAVPGLRAQLFTIVRASTPLKRTAAGLLTIIDRSRDSYGRPLAEPRHPHIASGLPWPSEAAEAWASLIV